MYQVLTPITRVLVAQMQQQGGFAFSAARGIAMAVERNIMSYPDWYQKHPAVTLHTYFKDHCDILAVCLSTNTPWHHTSRHHRWQTYCWLSQGEFVCWMDDVQSKAELS